MILGRLARVVLLAVVCDHPAMCKVSGLADHGHEEAPCGKCDVTREDLASESSLRNGAVESGYFCFSINVFVALEFPLRDGEDHRRKCFQWKEKGPEEREVFFKQYGVRWTELARLPYLDLIRCTIVDPMHNLLLGK